MQSVPKPDNYTFTNVPKYVNRREEPRLSSQMNDEEVLQADRDSVSNDVLHLWSRGAVRQIAKSLLPLSWLCSFIHGRFKLYCFTFYLVHEGSHDQVEVVFC